jgi:lipoprotein-anchoring transpeptidase ErfK/SrfK
LFQIYLMRDVELFTDLRDWWDGILSSTVECVMLGSTSRRLYGAALFFGLVTIPIVPAWSQALSFSQTDPNAPVYQSVPDQDEAPSPALRRQIVSYGSNEPAGTVIIDPAHTFLYLTLGNGQAMRYGIGVGREGFEWSGTETIVRKAEWPDWIPPAAMVARQPYLPRWIGGGPGNPLGARAMYLGNTDYRIHGTNAPSSIGKHMSSGCIRLLNEDVIDLFNRVGIGTKVIVLPDTQAQQISDAAPAPTAAPVVQGAADAAQSRTAFRSNGALSGIY